MRVDSPILALWLLPFAIVAIAAAGPWLPALARWLIRVASLAIMAAIAGPALQCERPLRIAVMVDVSPSTRGATFRDPLSVTTRLTPLLAGRPYTVHYFADGPVATPTEPAAVRTRLETPADADVIVLLSDGRFSSPTGLPAVYPVIDPTLDAPDDARVRDVRFAEPPTHTSGNKDEDMSGRDPHDRNGSSTKDTSPIKKDELNATGQSVDAPERFHVLRRGVLASQSASIKSEPHALPQNQLIPITIDVVSVAGQTLTLHGGSPGTQQPPAGASTLSARISGDRLVAQFEAGDRWPENDTLTIKAHRPTVRRLAIGVDIPGFESVAAFPADAAAYVGVAVVAIATSNEVSPTQSGAVETFIRDLGGTVVLVGQPSAASSTLQALAPLSAVPPVGPQAWILLLDASGSMATADGDRSRWARAITAAQAAVGQMPVGARVTVLRFAGDVRTIVDAAPAADALSAINLAAGEAPSGRTGLRAALESVARSPAAGARRVLLLTDGDADIGGMSSLAAMLRDRNITLSAVATNSSPDLFALCAATGGRLAANVSPPNWGRALGALTAAAWPPLERNEAWRGSGLLRDLSFNTALRWPAYAKDGVDIIVGDSTTPAVAVWGVGLGRVASVVADARVEPLDVIARALERPGADGRFDAAFDEREEIVRLQVIDATGPINGLTPILRRAGRETPFAATGPGAYAAPLTQSAEPSLATVSVDGAVVAQRALAGRYAAEFDMIGNDRAALNDLAVHTGGAVIEAGQNRPIAFTPRYILWPLQGLLTAASAVLMLAGLFTARRR